MTPRGANKINILIGFSKIGAGGYKVSPLRMIVTLPTAVLMALGAQPTKALQPNPLPVGMKQDALWLVSKIVRDRFRAHPQARIHCPKESMASPTAIRLYGSVRRPTRARDRSADPGWQGDLAGHCHKRHGVDPAVHLLRTRPKTSDRQWPPDLLLPSWHVGDCLIRRQWYWERF